VSSWPQGDGLVLYSARSGRHAVVDPASLADPSLELRERLARLDLVEGPGPDPARAVPVRSRLPLVRPADRALWHPVPSAHGAGGRAWSARVLTDRELRTWLAADGKATGEQVAARAGVAVDDVAALWRWACDPSVQAGQWRDRPVDPRDPSLLRIVGSPREGNARTADQYGEHGETSLGTWHLGLESVETHFDDRETTVAHAHGVPHPALGGRRYGEALADALQPRPGRIVEVGPGTGELVAAFLARSGLPSAAWLRIDLSPALLAEQEKRVPGSPGLVGDATRLPLVDGTVDLLISNEVIADLPASRVDGGWSNTGALAFVREVARVLAPGGRAWLSEFGGPDETPAETPQLDHPEVSIRFDDLVAVAEAHGLSARLDRLDAFLGFDLTARQLSRAHYQGLRAMFRAEGRHLAARAWTPETLAEVLPWPVEGLVWVPVSEPGPGPLVTRFWSLLLQAPV
jgi:SAM-dependent methyltransferase